MIKKILSSIEKALFPELRCFVCGREMHEPETGLCWRCQRKIKRIEGTHCEKCGMKILEGERFCTTCKNTKYDFTKARAAFVFDEVSSALVHGLKFKAKKFTAKMLAREMAKVFEDMKIAPDMIIPVPLHAKRKGKRGFNQSELIAEELSKLVEIQTEPNILSRIRQTSSQRGLSQKSRKENLEGAFACEQRELVKNKSVLLIDDVFTTGTTVDECSKVLRKAGAKNVFVLTALKTHFD